MLEERKVRVEALDGFASRDRDQPIRWRNLDVQVRAASVDALSAGGTTRCSSRAPMMPAPHLLKLVSTAAPFVIDNSATFRMIRTRR